ncbi:MAG: DUF4157 domain-containing protein, partial [Myxococcota bacterium]
MERAFGTSFAGVTLREDETSARRASALGVNAYTDGREVGFAPGAFAPETRAGRHMLAHEFAHVAQARGGNGGLGRHALGGAVLGYSPDPSNADAAEQDAHRAADDVLAGKTPLVGRFTIEGAAGQGPAPVTPPAGQVNVKKEKGSFVFEVSGATLKSWKNPLAECFKLYVRLAFVGVTEADVEACATANAASLSWVKDPGKDNPADTAQLSIEILPSAQVLADQWMKANGKTYAKVEPQAGSYGVSSKKGKGTGGSGGSEDGVVRKLFDPEGEVLLQGEQGPVVTGAEVKGLFRFTGDEEGKLYNYYPFVNRVDFAWTIKRGSTVVDTGPLFKGGSNTYSFSVKESGTHTVSVELSSAYFRNGVKPVRSVTFEAVTEEKKRTGAFETKHVGTEPGKAFERDAAGELKVKAGAPGSAAAIDEELKRLSFEMGMIEKSSELPSGKKDEYLTFYRERIAALQALQAKVGKGLDYVVSGVFVNRENSSTLDVRVTMTGRRVGVSDGRAQYAVAAYDLSLSNEPIMHSGSSTADASVSEATGYAQAEKQAIDAMASDWHWYNDYPDGTIQLGIGLKEATGVKTVVIDTWNAKKPAKKVLAGVAVVGGLVLAVGSGGTLAPVTVLVLEVATAAAAVALTVDSVLTRINNGTFRMDAQLMLDMLALVPIAGTLARMGGVLTANGLRLLSFGVMGSSMVLIADTTRQAIRDTEARYAGRIAAAATEDE